MGAASHRMTGCALIVAAAALAACGPRVGDAPPDLGVRASAPVWPSPPETARYALASVLIGEQDFIAPEKRQRSTARKALEFIAGLVIGDLRYKELRRPVSGLVRDDGSILVVDAGLKGVAVFDFPAKQFKIWDEAGDGGGFDSPVAIIEDGAGGYLVSDAELGRIVRLGPDGAPLGDFGGHAVRRPTGLARDPVTGLIYVADTASHDVKVFSPGGLLDSVIGGPGKGSGRFNTPTHLTFADGRLFVADTLNFRVQAFDRNEEPVLDFGDLGLNVGDLSRPKGVALGGDGRIYVVESYYDHLLIFDPAGRLLLPIGGPGADVGRFYLPAGVWTDPEGRVYVADMFNGRVVVLQELTDLEVRPG